MAACIFYYLTSASGVGGPFVNDGRTSGRQRGRGQQRRLGQPPPCLRDVLDDDARFHVPVQLRSPRRLRFSRPQVQRLQRQYIACGYNNIARAEFNSIQFN